MENTRFDIEKTALRPHHVRVKSGRGYIGFVPGTISGIKTLGFPPYTGHGYRLLTTFIDPVTGFHIRDWEEHSICESVARLELVGGFPDAAEPRSLYQGGDWLGWGIQRKGAVHWRQNDKLISFRLKTTAAPLTDRHGFCMSLEFTEIDIPGDSLVIKLDQSDFTLGAVRPWHWVDVVSDHPANRRDAVNFDGKECALNLGVAGGQLDGDVWTIPLDGKKSIKVHLIVVIAPTADEAKTQLEDVLVVPQGNLDRAEEEWTSQTCAMAAQVPEFRCDMPKLEAFYMGSLRTLLMNRWDTPEYMIRPFFSTSGMGFCNGIYIWDVSYCPKILSLWDHKTLRRHLVQWLLVDLHACNQFTPFDGGPMGCWYSLNDFSIVKLVFEYCGITGDRDFLNQELGNGTVIQYIERLLEESETRFESKDGLLNYGRNENLLELRSSGYEGYVASPNGERYFCWMRLAEMKEWLNISAVDCRKKADTIKEGFFRKLWNEEKRWPDAITPEGHRETPYSVQVFNLLSSGLFDGDHLDGLLSHLNDAEFLSSHGVESISKTDIRYELNDLDWSGGGTYLGCCPVMVVDLYQMGRPAEAWKVLQRLLWWPEVFPYYPQVVRAGKAGYEERQRPICISSGAAAETILFGIFGLRYDLDGSVSVCVELPPEMKTASLRRVKLREGVCDILVENGLVVIQKGGERREIPRGVRVSL